MTFVLTLLTLFLDGKPDAPPPSPVPSAAFSPFAAPVAQQSATSETSPISPSLMVAVPPVPATPFDVYSPALRPPQQFPTLFPTPPVTLLPPPALPEPRRLSSLPYPILPSPGVADFQTPIANPPVVRPAGFATVESASNVVTDPAVQTASFVAPAKTVNEAQCPTAKSVCETQCPVGTACKTLTVKINPTECCEGLIGKVLWKHLKGSACPSGTQCDQSAYEELDYKCPQQTPHVASPVPGYPHWRPAPPVPYLPPNPYHVAGLPHPVPSPHSPFPGAKKVQHVVSATYDVPNETATRLKPILENSNGVLGCVVKGNEITINAAAPAQSAIAQFLTHVVAQSRTKSYNTVNQTGRGVSVKYSVIKSSTTKPDCCNDKCECKDKCQCCGKKDKDQTATESLFKHYFQSETARAIERNLGFDCCPQAATISKAATCKPPSRQTTKCEEACKSPTVVKWQTKQSNPVRVTIYANSNGVSVKTSNGTQLQAKQIHFETDGVNKMQVEQADAVFTLPKRVYTPDTKPQERISY